jgi:hypothetical protein
MGVKDVYSLRQEQHRVLKTETAAKHRLSLKADSANIGNDQMLAADVATKEMRRFLTGSNGCEVTGVVATLDGRTAFREYPDKNRRSAVQCTGQSICNRCGNGFRADFGEHGGQVRKREHPMVQRTTHFGCTFSILPGVPEGGKSQIPPDLVVKYQAIDIVEVIFR